MGMPDAGSCSFDRFLTAVYRREPDRVPLAEVSFDQEIKDAFMGRPVCTLADDVAFWAAAGYDFVVLETDLWSTPQVQASIITPLANTAGLYSSSPHERRWVATEAGVIKTRDDAERFVWPQADWFDYSPYEEVRRYLPPGMKVVASLGHIFTTAWQLMGFEHFCLSLHEDPGLVRDIIDQLGRETLASLERILSHESVGAVWLQDDIAYTNGLVIPPARLRELFFPWLNEAAALCHARGRPLLYHSDGDLRQVLPDIVAAGVDALHPIEPKCMDIVAVKREYGDRLALVGNLDLGYTLTRGTPQEVREEVRFLIKHVAPGGGYLLGSANSITNYVPLENLKAMLAATLDYGRYPIALQ